jgi:hypothetical protein
MAVLVLNKDEIEVLSLLSGVRINSFSPFGRLEGFDREAFIAKKDIHNEVIKNYLKDGAVWKDESGRPQLIRELKGVMEILNDPDRTIKITTASKNPLEENYYCSKGELGVMFSVGKEGVFYTLTYPFTKPMLSTWFFDEIIGDLGVEKKDEISSSWQLASDEFEMLTLLMINRKYLNLKEKDSPIKVESLMDKELLAYVNSNNYVKLSEKTVSAILEHDKKDEILKSLADKGMINISEGIVEINEILSGAFESGNLRDRVSIEEITPFMRGKNLYITNLGYIIFEPVISNPVEWNISIEGLKTYPFKLVEKLLEFSDIKPGEKLREELEKRIKN